MININSTEFGSITIDDNKYGQVLIIGDKVTEREFDRLKQAYGTSHKIGDWEVTEILKENPEIILKRLSPLTKKSNQVKELMR